MKKVLCIVLAVMFVVSLYACAADKGTEPADSTKASVTEPDKKAEPEKEVKYDITDKRVVQWTDSIGTPYMLTIIEIANTGTVPLYLGSSSSSFDIEDENGKLLKSVDYFTPYPDIIDPGEKGYVCEETMLDAPLEGELTILPHLDIEESKKAAQRLPVSDFELTDDKYMGINMKGRVENNTEEEITSVYVVALLFDADGKCLGEIFSIEDKIAAGDKIGFEQAGVSLPKGLTTDDVADTVVYAYENYMQF